MSIGTHSGTGRNAASVGERQSPPNSRKDGLSLVELHMGSVVVRPQHPREKLIPLQSEASSMFPKHTLSV